MSAYNFKNFTLIHCFYALEFLSVLTSVPHLKQAGGWAKLIKTCQGTYIWVTTRNLRPQVPWLPYWEDIGLQPIPRTGVSPAMYCLSIDSSNNVPQRSQEYTLPSVLDSWLPANPGRKPVLCPSPLLDLNKASLHLRRWATFWSAGVVVFVKYISVYRTLSM